MKTQLEVFDIIFRTPLVFGNETLLSRKGLYITLWNDKGEKAMGEISPLPGCHKETLQELISALYEHYPLLEQFSAFNDEEFEATVPFFNLLPKDLTQELMSTPLYGHPSLRFGLEQVLWNLYKKTFQRHPIQFKRQALYFADEILQQDVSKLLNDFQEQEIKTIKIKIGFGELEQELSFCSKLGQLALHKNYPLKIRLDPNNRLMQTQQGREEFMSYLPLLSALPLDFIEDIDLSFSLPTAYDAFLSQHITAHGDFTHDFPKNLKAIVIKPTLYGLSKSIQIINKAQEKKIPIIISSTFDSGLTLTTLVELAELTGLLEETHGLDTDRFLRNHPHNWTLKGPRGTPVLLP